MQYMFICMCDYLYIYIFGRIIHMEHCDNLGLYSIVGRS